LALSIEKPIAIGEVWVARRDRGKRIGNKLIARYLRPRHFRSKPMSEKIVKIIDIPAILGWARVKLRAG
jgi:predicted GNAT family N-acyltransferase